MKKQKNAPLVLPREEWPYEVPENWIWTNLQSICAIPITDGTHKTPTYCDAKDGFPFISSKDVTDQHINWNNIKYITPELHNELYARLAPQIDDILLAKNGTTGVAALVETDQIFDIYVTLAVIRPNQIIINPKYIFHLVNSPLCKQQFNEHLTGIGLPNLHLRDIKATMIPLPPLPEQQRIVARIESLFAKLDAAAEKIRAALDQFPIRKAAILHKAFTGELTKNWREENGINNTWKTVPLKDIGEIITGSTPSTKHAEYYNGNIPFIKPTELDQGRKIMTSAEMLTAQGLSVSRPIRVGATCVCCIGATIGKCGYLAVDGVTNQQINSIIPYEFIDDLFVYYYCCSTKFKNDLIQNSSATTLPIINKSRMSSLEINYPQNENEQKEIVRIFDAIFEREQAAKETAERLLIRIALIKKSILARAFRGLLGTNAPKEESAEGLLRGEPA